MLQSGMIRLIRISFISPLKNVLVIKYWRKDCDIMFRFFFDFFIFAVIYGEDVYFYKKVFKFMLFKY